MENETLSLISKKKKGLLRVLFSRVGLMTLLILLQVAVFFGVYYHLYRYFHWLVLAQDVFTLVMVIYLFSCEMEHSGKLTWLALIALFPVPASILLWYTRMDFGNRMTKRRIEQLVEESRNKLQQDSEILLRPELNESGTADLSRFLCRSGAHPIFENTQVKYFSLGEEEFAVMLEELQKAEHFIFMEYFILDEGYMWGSILKILAEKAAQGVDVRVMYDGMCEVSLLPHDYPKRMAKLGIQCKAFTPIMPFVSTQYNYRDHRKILVIDGKVAFNGGVNLADEYINRINRFGHWKDTAVMLTGEAVQSFTLMFLQMWNLDENDPQWDAFLTPYKVGSDGFVLPFGDCPLDRDKTGEVVYMDILNRAKKYVHIMTPYLILDNELENTLKYAAQRGIDVKIILPGIPDKKIAYSLTKSHYRTLIRAGVKLYEYTPGFIHAKTFVSDNEKAVVGTINLDYRSFYHHFECATYLYRTSCISEISEDFEDTLSKCRAVTPESIRKEKLFYKLVGKIMKVFAPLV